MTIKAAVLEALLAAGASAEMIVAAIKADAIEDDERKARKREKDAERQRRYRLSRSVTRCHTHVTRDTSSPSPEQRRKVSPTPPSKEETQTLFPSPKESEPNGSPKKTPKENLLVVLDEEHASAVVEHRFRLRKPLTAHAAKLLADKLAKAPEPNAAADAMIVNGWQGFETEWLDNQQRGPPNGARNGKRNGMVEAFDRIIEHERSLEYPEQQPPSVASKRN